MSGTALSIGQFAELAAAVMKALPRDISPADALAWARSGRKLQQVLAVALSHPPPLMSNIEHTPDLIIYRVCVDRSRAPMEAIVAVGHHRSCREATVAAMPCGEGEEVTVHFFKVGRKLEDNELAQEYAARGLTPADPYSMFAIDEADPTFVDGHPHGTYWEDVDGTRYVAECDRWPGGDRHIFVNLSTGHWGKNTWFAGLPQKNSASPV